MGNYDGWREWKPDGTISERITPPRTKYGATKTTLDGIVFDSKKECVRYQALKLLERVGAIRDLELQVEFDCLAINAEVVCRYVADFRYWSVEHNKQIIEDVKSKATKTRAYRIKFKLLRAQGIQITEV